MRSNYNKVVKAYLHIKSKEMQQIHEKRAHAVSRTGESAHKNR